jgi:membrane protease YdiL (CAAX protease family)
VIDAWDRLIAIVEILLCSSVPTQLAIGALLRLAGLRSTDAAGHLSLAFVLALSLLDTGILIVMMVMLMHAHGETARGTWLGRNADAQRANAGPVVSWKEALIGLATVPIVFVGVGILLNAIRLFAPSLHNVAHNPLADLARTRVQAIVFVLVVMIAGGVREEIQRGFILHRFEQFLGGGATGIVVFSVVFGLGHVEQGRDVALATAVLGAFWGLIYLRRRSIAAPMVSHAGFNLLQVLNFLAGGAG